MLKVSEHNLTTNKLDIVIKRGFISLDLWFFEWNSGRWIEGDSGGFDGYLSRFIRLIKVMLK